VVRYFLSESFEVVIEDNGLKARPESIKGRSLDDVKPGGLGIHFIKRIFDVFAFDPEKKRGNRLRLIRYRREDDENSNKGE
jgi:anti-sigma regulatory factor (Ser/Thr protein kinase)